MKYIFLIAMLILGTFLFTEQINVVSELFTIDPDC